MACGFGACFAGPPNPPSPRSTVVPLSVTSFSPVLASRTTRSLNNSEPFSAPLSMISVMAVRLAQPKPGISEHDGHRRQSAQIPLIDEAQLLLVHRIAAETEAKRIEDRVARRIFVGEFLERPVQQFLHIERHLKNSLPSRNAINEAPRIAFGIARHFDINEPRDSE